MIIYPRTGGGVCVVIPVADCGLTEAEIAAKDVPTGRPYKIVPSEAIPTDRTFRDAWEADFTAPDGHGADHGVTESEDWP